MGDSFLFLLVPAGHRSRFFWKQLSGYVSCGIHLVLPVQVKWRLLQEVLRDTKME